jgi:hypothetical protein
MSLPVEGHSKGLELSEGLGQTSLSLRPHSEDKGKQKAVMDDESGYGDAPHPLYEDTTSLFSEMTR